MSSSQPLLPEGGGGGLEPNRDDLSSGMMVVPPRAIHDNEQNAGPLICFPFHLKEQSALPAELLKIVWILHSTQCNVQNGKTHAFMNLKKDVPFTCRFRGKNEKPIIVEEGGAIQAEMQMEIRILSMEKENYLVLIARTHAAFSLRHALIHTLSQTIVPETDERRIAINSYAQSLRETLGVPLMNELERGDSIDWMKVSNEHSFTPLFSVQGMVHWIACHYLQLYPQATQAHLEGFGDLVFDELEPPSGTFLFSCATYDKAVDIAIALTYGEPNPDGAQKKKKKKKKKKQKRKSIGSKKQARSSLSESLQDDVEEDDAEEEEEDAEEEEEDDSQKQLEQIVLLPPQGFMLDEEKGITGFPSTDICIFISTTVFVAGPVTFEKFGRMMHMLPTSVSVKLLQARLNIKDLDLSQILLTDPLGEEERNTILKGKKQVAGKSFYSNGDAKWSRGFMNAVNLLPQEKVQEKLSIVNQWIQMSIPLAFTRAKGSDTYTNARAAMAGDRMKDGHDVSDDNTECGIFFEEFIIKMQKGLRYGCTMHEALIAFIKIVQSTNKMAWSLRPDNLFLFLQFLISDLMLSLNFHGSVIEGSENGIGSTIVVHDGGGAYCAHEKVILTKNNGCGADFVISVLENMIDMTKYDERLLQSKEADKKILQEIRRSSEMGLYTLSCNVIKGTEGSEEIVSRIIEVSARLYTTEMRLHTDAMSGAAIQALITSVSRQTRSNNPNMQTSTDIDPKTKIRVPVKYIQAIMGYLAACSNNLVGDSMYERFFTFTKVARCILSSADSMDAASKDEFCGEQSLAYGKRTYVPSAQHASILKSNKCRSIFLSAFGVAHFTAFMQWTGMLGKISASMIVEEILESFYSQLDLSKDMLNTVKYSPDDRGRCFEIGKARIIATNLLATSIESMVTVGKHRRSGNRTGTLYEATEIAAFKFIYRGISPSLLPWLMSDTMESMFATDKMILMQYFCKKFQVPQDLAFQDVLIWLRDGSLDQCSEKSKQKLTDFLQKYEQVYLKVAPLETPIVRDALTCGMYISHPHLQVTINPVEIMDFKEIVQKKLGTFIYHEESRDFNQYCQINRTYGEEIIQHTLSEMINHSMAWPTVFGIEDTLPHFWQGSPPPQNNVYKQKRLILEPIRIARMEATKIYLAVDVRWLLMMGSITGCKPCQAARTLFVATWVKYFYKWCVPGCLTYSEELITGLPSPKMGYGIITPTVIPTNRKFIGRPVEDIARKDLIPSPTGMIEDLAIVSERYQLAKFLNVSPDDIPTHKVSYTFPLNIWVPVEWEDDIASIKYTGRGVFLFCSKANPTLITNIAARPEESGFLDGRLKEDVRPLCFFDRPGVLLFHPDPAVIKAYDHTHGAYSVVTSQMQEAFIDPKEMETLVCKIGTSILIQGHTIQASLVKMDADEHVQEVKEQRDINEACLVMATLRIPDHNTLRDDDVPVFVTGYRIHHRSNDLESMEDEDVVSDSTKCKMPFNISIKAVVAVFKAQTDYYHGMVL